MYAIFERVALPSYLKECIDAVIQRNGYFAHPDNLLLAMLTDERHDVRSLAIRRIQEAKDHFVEITSIRHSTN